MGDVKQVNPTPEDLERARRETPNFEELSHAEKYRLAQAAALIRVYGESDTTST